MENVAAMKKKNDKIMVMMLPDMWTTARMNHSRLILLLRHCPLSPYFGSLPSEVSKSTFGPAAAKDKVLRLILERQIALDTIDEANSASERSH